MREKARRGAAAARKGAHAGCSAFVKETGRKSGERVGEHYSGTYLCWLVWYSDGARRRSSKWAWVAWSSRQRQKRVGQLRKLPCNGIRW